MTGANNMLSTSGCAYLKEETDVLLDDSLCITNEKSSAALLFHDLIHHAVNDDANSAGGINTLELAKRIFSEFHRQGGRFLERRHCKGAVAFGSVDPSNFKKNGENNEEQSDPWGWFELNQDISLANILSTLRNSVSLRQRESMVTIEKQEGAPCIPHFQQEEDHVEILKPVMNASACGHWDIRRNPHGKNKRAFLLRQKEPVFVKKAIVPFTEVIPLNQGGVSEGKAVQTEGTEMAPSNIKFVARKKRLFVKQKLQRNRPPPAPIAAMQPRIVSLRKASTPWVLPAPRVTKEGYNISATRTAEEQVSASALLCLHDFLPTVTNLQFSAASNKFSVIDCTTENSRQGMDLEEKKNSGVDSVGKVCNESTFTAEALGSDSSLMLRSSVGSPYSLSASTKDDEQTSFFSVVHRSLVPPELAPFKEPFVAGMVTRTDRGDEIPVNTKQNLDTTIASCHIPVVSNAKEPGTQPTQLKCTKAQKYAESFDSGHAGCAATVPRELVDSEKDVARLPQARARCDNSVSTARLMRKGQPSGEQASYDQCPKFDAEPPQGIHAFHRQCDKEEALSSRSGESSCQDTEMRGQNLCETSGTLMPEEGRKSRKRPVGETSGTAERQQTTLNKSLGFHLTLEECALMLSNPATSARDADMVLQIVSEQVKPTAVNSEKNKWQFVCQAVLCAVRGRGHRAIKLPKALALLSVLIQGLELECNRVLVCEDVVPEVLSILQRAISYPPSGNDEGDNDIILSFCGDILWHLSQNSNGREVIIGYGGATAVLAVVSARVGLGGHLLNNVRMRTHFVRLHLRILQDYTGQSSISCFKNALSMDRNPFSVVTDGE